MTELTTRTVSYPSRELPAPPAFAVDVPEGWEAGQVPGLLAVIGPTAWDGPFRPNVTVSAGLIPKDSDLATIARSHLESMAGEGSQIVDLEELEPDIVQVALTTPIADPALTIFQTAVLFRVDGRPERSELADLFTVTASCDGDQAGEHMDDLVEIIRSFRAEAG